MIDRSLKDFAKWYLGREGVINLRIPEGALRVGPMSTEIVLYRDPPFQVSLMTFFPGYTVPPHHHEHVSTYNFNLGDNTGLTVVAGREYTGGETGVPGIKQRVPIPAGVVHSGQVSKHGAFFLSVQKWEGKEPGFISDDWYGATSFEEIPNDKA